MKKRAKKKREICFSIAGISGIGAREDQQDAMWFSGMSDESADFSEANVPGNGSCLAVVADGMGGLAGGGEISRLVTEGMRNAYFAPDKPAQPVYFLQNALWKVNEEVNRYLIGRQPGGSTIIAACVMDQKLYYLSVGDSRVYLYHKNSLRQLNIEHNYGRDLDELVRRGAISETEAKTHVQRAALTSYVGMGTISQVDGNEAPISLEIGDVVMLLTDGAFRTVSDEELARCASRDSAEEIVRAIARAVVWEKKQRQDNYTAVAIRMETC